MEFLLEYAEEEVWRPIPSFPKYLVSHLGNIKTGTGHPKSLRSEKLTGYMRTTFFNSTTKKNVGVRVHNLVAEAFLPPDPQKPYVDHIDRNKSNNSVFNLRRVTPKENSQNTTNVEVSRERCRAAKAFVDGNPTATPEDVKNTLGISTRTFFKYKRKWTMIEK